MILVCGAVFLLSAIIVFIFFLNSLLAMFYGGRLFSALAQLRHQSTASFSFDSYIGAGRLWFSRLSFLVILFNLILAACVARESMRRTVVDFFTKPTSSINLAIFRIAVFGVTLYFFSTTYETTQWFATFPHDLQFPPYGVAWLLPHLPITPGLVHVASICLIIFCITGFIGFFARTSALLATLFGLYVLGITQLYGKVSHDHEYLWFMTLLAVSPCADSISVDAVVAAFKRADRGNTAPPADSLAYALPLRIASVLIGLIYFFPGFWKFWKSGFDWAFSDNLKYQMYSKWMEYDGWTPFFRLDQHPWMYRGMAFGTLCLEMSFVFLIFFPYLRRLAVLGGVAFHVGSYFFLRIFFYDMIVFYVALFDVAAALRKLGQRLFRSQLTVFYDDDCSFCRRTISAFRVFDLLGTIQYVRARQDSQLYLDRFPQADASRLIEDMHAVCGDRQFLGMNTYRAMALRIPFLWPLVPVLSISWVKHVADRIYNRVKHSRVCKIDFTAAAPSELPSVISRSSVWGTVAVGIVLIAGSFYTGCRSILSGWPFACFPTFAFIADDHISTLEIVAVKSDGTLLPTDTESLRTSFADQRLRGLLESALRNPGDSYERLRNVWQLYVQQDPRLENAVNVRFYHATLCIVPEKRALNPLSRELITELQD